MAVLRAPGGAGRGLFVPVECPCLDSLVHSGSIRTHEDFNYLKTMTFFKNLIFVFDKPTCLFFMVGGLQAARLRVLGIPIL